MKISCAFLNTIIIIGLHSILISVWFSRGRADLVFIVSVLQPQPIILGDVACKMRIMYFIFADIIENIEECLRTQYEYYTYIVRFYKTRGGKMKKSNSDMCTRT